MSQIALDTISNKLPHAVIERYTDRTQAPWAVIDPSFIREVCSVLKNDPSLDFKLFLSMDGVDRLLLPVPTPRFEIVYFIRSLKLNDVVRFKCRVDEDRAELP